MGHITPEEFRASMSSTERDGGSYNRLLILPVQQVRWLSERDQMPAHLIPEAGELFARAVRHGRRVGTVVLSDDAYDVADVIRQDLLTKARESEDLKPFAARCNEQARRIAALFALFDLRSEITPDDLEAAARLVTYSMESVETITTGAGCKGNRRQPLSLAEKVRARIELHGGRATPSQILPYVGATAAEVKALPGIVVTQDRSGVGRPATVFTLRHDSSSHAEAQPASTEREENGDADPPAVVPVGRPRLRLVADAPPPRPVKRSAAPAHAQSNPFHDLL